MADIPIESAAHSPLALFTEALAHGGVAITATGPRARAFPPHLALVGELDATHALGSARTGIVFSATEVSTRAGAHVLGLIDLDGGGRLLARIRSGDEAASLIGRAVALVATPNAGEPPLTFEPISEGEGA